MVVAPGWGPAMVGLPILEKTTNAEGTPEEAAGRLSQIHNPVPEVNPDSMNPNADPSFQTPVDWSGSGLLGDDDGVWLSWYSMRRCLLLRRSPKDLFFLALLSSLPRGGLG